MRPERVTMPALGEGLAGRTIARLPGGGRLSPVRRVAIALAVLVLLLLAALVTEPWGFMALGSAVGLLVVARVPAARAALMPVAALGSAGLPLLLPLLVFVAAGVIKSPGKRESKSSFLRWSVDVPRVRRLLPSMVGSADRAQDRDSPAGCPSNTLGGEMLGLLLSRVDPGVSAEAPATLAPDDKR